MNVLKNPYCTVEDVQRETQNTSPDDVQKFISAINQASRWIDGYTHRDFLFHDATGGMVVEEGWAAFNKIYLPWPIITLTKVETADEFGNMTEMLATDYRAVSPIGSFGGVIEASGRWYDVRKDHVMRTQVKIYGAFGYPAAVAGDVQLAPNQTFSADQWPSPLVPAEIASACAVIAAVRSGKARKDIVGFDGQKTSATVKTVPKESMDALCRYRRPIL
jgi:hypothetical protein